MLLSSPFLEDSQIFQSQGPLPWGQFGVGGQQPSLPTLALLAKTACAQLRCLPLWMAHRVSVFMTGVSVPGVLPQGGHTCPMFSLPKGRELCHLGRRSPVDQFGSLLSRSSWAAIHFVPVCPSWAGPGQTAPHQLELPRACSLETSLPSVVMPRPRVPWFPKESWACLELWMCALGPGGGRRHWQPQAPMLCPWRGRA